MLGYDLRTSKVTHRLMAGYYKHGNAYFGWTKDKKILPPFYK